MIFFGEQSACLSHGAISLVDPSPFFGVWHVLLGEGDMVTQQHVDIHASRGNLILVLVILFPGLATLVVLLRVYTRFILLRTPAIDDAFILLALVSILIIPS